MAVYAYYFYDTSVIFSISIITYREPFTICIGHDRRTDVIGIDWYGVDKKLCTEIVKLNYLNQSATTFVRTIDKILSDLKGTYRKKIYMITRG